MDIIYGLSTNGWVSEPETSVNEPETSVDSFFFLVGTEA
jgi:hypothetical protein